MYYRICSHCAIFSQFAKSLTWDAQTVLRMALCERADAIHAGGVTTLAEIRWQLGVDKKLGCSNI